MWQKAIYVLFIKQIFFSSVLLSTAQQIKFKQFWQGASLFHRSLYTTTSTTVISIVRKAMLSRWLISKCYEIIWQFLSSPWWIIMPVKKAASVAKHPVGRLDQLRNK